MTVVNSASTPCCVLTAPVAMLHVAVPPERLSATCVYGAYVRPMFIHVRLLEAMLGPCSGHVELMLSQERRVPFKPLPGPKGTRRFWMFLDHVGTMLGVSGAYARPMLIHVRLFLGGYVGPIFRPC